MERKSLKITKKKEKKKKKKPSQKLLDFLKKKYDDPNEKSKVGDISKGRKAREEALKMLNQY